MLRLSPKHKIFRSPDKAIIDPAELVIAEEKVLQLSQLESIAADCKQLAAAKHLAQFSLSWFLSMYTSSCVMAIERFISRRGTPSIIWSDNGTNFIGAEKELLLCIKNRNADAPLSLVH